MTRLSKITGRPLDIITLRDLAVQCVIGVHPEEKVRAQTLILDVRLFLDTSAAAYSGLLTRSVDYSLIARQLTFILTHSRFRLLESAAEALAIYLLSPQPGETQMIEAVDIEIRKPEALQGLAVPSVRIIREREDLAVRMLALPASPILFQVPEAVLERRTIAAGDSLVFEAGEDLAVFTEQSGLQLGTTILPTAAALLATQRLVIDNPGADARSVLAVIFRGRERFQLQQDRLH